MDEFITFNSLEEMLDYEAKAEAKANEAIVEKQREVVWGSHFIKVNHDIAVFGYVPTKEENHEGILRASGHVKIVADAEMEDLEKAYDRGYRFAMHYSAAVPKGELGSSHLSQLWPITKEEFLQAKAESWLPQLGEPWFNDLLRRILHESRGVNSLTDENNVGGRVVEDND